MVEISSVEFIEIKSNNHQFRLSKVNEIEDNFIAEIKERELMSKKRPSKYIAFLIILIIL